MKKKNFLQRIWKNKLGKVATISTIILFGTPTLIFGSTMIGGIFEDTTSKTVAKKPQSEQNVATNEDLKITEKTKQQDEEIKGQALINQQEEAQNRELARQQEETKKQELAKQQSEKKRAEEERKKAEEKRIKIENEKKQQAALKKQQNTTNKKPANPPSSSNAKTYYIAAGNRYYHNSSNCKFLKSSTATATTNISNKFPCNCIK